MFFAYYDESGDDGFPSTSSPLFVLSCIYFHFQNWQSHFDRLYTLKQHISQNYDFPIKLEMHTRDFLLGKNLYHLLGISENEKIEIINLYCQAIANMDMKVINVVINKSIIKTANYDVLDRAFTYSIQRIENDLNNLDPASKFMIITDPGRVGKMRKTARRIRALNYIPSKYNPGSYRREITRLIEDPLEKESSQSYFIQIADMIAFIIYQYKRSQFGLGNFPKRLLQLVDDSMIKTWINTLIPVLNLRASTNDPYGIVCYPK